jgi:hypothetical protein
VAYLNLLYRRKAGAARDEGSRAEWITMAEELIGRVKKLKEQRAQNPRR